MSGSEIFPWVAWPAGAYLVGSIPFGLLIARARGADIRHAGSGNIGATNVGRVLGRKWGMLCFVLDVLKGFVPVLLAGLWLGGAVTMECGGSDAALAGWHGHLASFASDHAYGCPIAGDRWDSQTPLVPAYGWHGHPAVFASDHAYGRPLGALPVFSPKGWDSLAQGRASAASAALGWRAAELSQPEGLRHACFSLSGWIAQDRPSSRGFALGFAVPGLRPEQRPTGVGAQALWLLVAFGAIAGHVFPVWLRFRGGKGVATSLGCVLGFYPYFTWAGLAALGVWIVVVKVTRYVSAASIAAAAAFPVLFLGACLAFGWPVKTLWPLLAFATAMAAMIVVRHRANIRRLLAGTESKIRGKKS